MDAQPRGRHVAGCSQARLPPTPGLDQLKGTHSRPSQRSQQPTGRGTRWALLWGGLARSALGVLEQPFGEPAAWSCSLL